MVVISQVRSRVTIRITHIKGLINPLIITHEPPSRLGQVSLFLRLAAAVRPLLPGLRQPGMRIA